MDFLVWQDTWQRIIEQVEDEGLYSLTPDERLWYNVRQLMDTAEDGGLLSYYYTPHADQMEQLLKDLKKLDAKPALAILTEINQQFPKGNPPQDLDTRIDIMENWDEELFEGFTDKLDDDFYEYMNELEELLDPIIEKIMKVDK